MDDQELLNALVPVAEQLRQAVIRQADSGYGTTHEDPRWMGLVPLRNEFQVKHLFVQAMDAFDVALRGLGARTSAVAIGAVRFLAETYVLLSWLTEPSSEFEKKKRSYELAVENIVGIQRVLKHDVPDPFVAERLTNATESLYELANQDGISNLGHPPDKVDLFKQYLEPGYVFFATTSQIGSHPGFLQILVFHQDPESAAPTTIDIYGHHGERAAWVSAAFELFALASARVGESLGWDDWIKGELKSIIEAGAPLKEEARTRWVSKWSPEVKGGEESQEDQQEAGPDD